MLINQRHLEHLLFSREIKANCLSLSSTNKTCYNVEKGFRCTEGWKEIPFNLEGKIILKQTNPNNANIEICTIDGCYKK